MIKRKVRGVYEREPHNGVGILDNVLSYLVHKQGR